jgi:hypothetical protein
MGSESEKAFIWVMVAILVAVVALFAVGILWENVFPR